jgi:hypothetical protein
LPCAKRYGSKGSGIDSTRGRTKTSAATFEVNHEFIGARLRTNAESRSRSIAAFRAIDVDPRPFAGRSINGLDGGTIEWSFGIASGAIAPGARGSATSGATCATVAGTAGCRPAGDIAAFAPATGKGRKRNQNQGTSKCSERMHWASIFVFA